MGSSLSFYETQLVWVVQSRGCWILQVSAYSPPSPPQCAVWTADAVRTCRQIQGIHDWQMRVCRNQVRSSSKGAFIWNIELCTILEDGMWRREVSGKKQSQWLYQISSSQTLFLQLEQSSDAGWSCIHLIWDLLSSYARVFALLVPCSMVFPQR